MLKVIIEALATLSFIIGTSWGYAAIIVHLHNVVVQ